jgi:hypothetical protein
VAVLVAAQVVVINDETVNAFVLPGGKIVVFTGEQQGLGGCAISHTLRGGAASSNQNGMQQQGSTGSTQRRHATLQPVAKPV